MAEQKAFHINPNNFRVVIFGSARIKSNDPSYNQIYRLAKMIAKEGMDIVTGGGPGLMEAANKGHKDGREEKKVNSYGLNIMLPNEQQANKHLDIQEDFNRFSQRLDYFMKLSDVVVVAPGGIGTVLEFMYAWQLMQVEHTCRIPIILLGDMWKPLIQWFEEWPLKKKMISPSDLAPITIAHHVRETMKIIRKAYQLYNLHGPDFCWNYEKYEIDAPLIEDRE